MIKACGREKKCLTLQPDYDRFMMLQAVLTNWNDNKLITK
ncbi:hypothetical protein HMPREF1990_00426 [Porphyromonas gingivalis W4087]|nr:hypothetical protein HMPREF1553_01712 [Porphyromonas gingivalis F0568]ERJ82576.1 hypothetical protein HMPREF1988_01481 [Porphyromonas gingivalis F0185]ERJ90869.1 hypothetical protein HMPREF1990_00426 [Porphyromonas gingivalis W4087]